MRGHVALCILAATIEAVMAKDLAAAKVMDPDLGFQHMTPRRALAELAEVRLELVSAGERNIELISRPTPLQAKVFKPSAWTPPAGERLQSPDLGEQVPRSGNTFSTRPYLPGLTN